MNFKHLSLTQKHTFEFLTMLFILVTSSVSVLFWFDAYLDYDVKAKLSVSLLIWYTKNASQRLSHAVNQIVFYDYYVTLCDVTKLQSCYQPGQMVHFASVLSSHSAIGLRGYVNQSRLRQLQRCIWAAYVPAPAAETAISYSMCRPLGTLYILILTYFFCICFRFWHLEAFRSSADPLGPR